MEMIHANGLKFCGLIQYPPSFYASGNDFWPVTQTANFCAWLATTGLVDAIEVINEANNIAQFGGPNNGGTNANLQALVNLTNSCRAAVQAVAPSIPVIGLDEQGSEPGPRKDALDDDQGTQQRGGGDPHNGDGRQHPIWQNVTICHSSLRDPLRAGGYYEITHRRLLQPGQEVPVEKSGERDG